VELSFFFVLITLSVYLSYYSVIFLLKPALKKKGMLYIYLFLSIGLFFLNKTAGVFIGTTVASAILYREIIKKDKFFYAGLKILFFIGLILLCFFYIPAADKIWDYLKGLYTGSIRKALPAAASLDLVFIAARFFRFIYPACIAAGAAFFLMITAGRHYASFWNRFLIKFNHKQIILLVVSWTIFWIFEVLGDFIGNGLFASFFLEILLLNCCLYFSSFYIIYGFLIINYLLKKRRVPYTLTTILVYGVIIASGNFILYILLILLGIGITDIWMDYTKKKIKFNTII